jgi:hypothetical protein
VAEQQHQLPGHVGRDQIVHIKDKPGKLNSFPNLIVPLPGRSTHEGKCETGDVREGPEARAGQQENDDSGGQGRDQLSCEGGPSQAQKRHVVWPGGQPEQHGGGQHDVDNGGPQVLEVGVGGVAGGGKKSVLARMSQLSVVVQNLGGGGISAKQILNDRKRKWQGPTTDDV